MPALPPKAHIQDTGGSIWVRVVQTEKDLVQISVRDEGVGLPAGFDPATSKRLGSRLINALAKQLGSRVNAARFRHWRQFFVAYSISVGRCQSIPPCGDVMSAIGIFYLQSAPHAV